VKETEQGGVTPARPPKDVLESLLARNDPLSGLRGITGTPVFSPEGRLVPTVGYQAETGWYYAPAGEPVPPVLETPTSGEVAAARALLCEEWLADFPFREPSSRAHAVAALVTVVARPLYEGPAPLVAIDAPGPGSGKGLLAETMGAIAMGSSPLLMTYVSEEAELRKQLTSVLSEGAAVVLLDNVQRPVSSATFAALLTAPVWSDRLLSTNRMARLPNRTLWLMTGNNLELSREMSRRSVWVRLDPQVDRPWERSGFRHDPLATWVAEHRHQLVWALLVLVGHWLARGRPRWQGTPLGSFERWSQTVGGILQAVGIEGFLDNRQELYRRADPETEEWRRFIEVWWGRFSDNTVSTADLYPFVQDLGLLPSWARKGRKDEADRAARTRLGIALRTHLDRRYGDWFLRNPDTDRNGAALWCLERAEPQHQAGRGSAEVPRQNGGVLGTNAEPAELAEPISPSYARENCDAGDRGEEEKNKGAGGPEVMQVMQVPRVGTKRGSGSAEPRVEVSREVPRSGGEVPRGTEPKWRRVVE
jgi:hypothetical protein